MSDHRVLRQGTRYYGRAQILGAAALRRDCGCGTAESRIAGQRGWGGCRRQGFAEDHTERHRRVRAGHRPRRDQTACRRADESMSAQAAAAAVIGRQTVDPGGIHAGAGRGYRGATMICNRGFGVIRYRVPYKVL